MTKTRTMNPDHDPEPNPSQAWELFAGTDPLSAAPVIAFYTTTTPN